MLEFDRRRLPDIELSFIGVTPALIGKGAGRALLRHCLPLAWEHQPQRVWLTPAPPTTPQRWLST